MLNNFLIIKFPLPLKLIAWMTWGWLFIYVDGLMCDCKLRGEEKKQIFHLIINIYFVISSFDLASDCDIVEAAGVNVF